MNIQEKKEEISRQLKNIFNGRDSAFEQVVRELIFNNSDYDIEQAMHKYMPETVDKRNLSKGEALFNCHINDAKNRAVENFKGEFGEKIFNMKIEPYFDRGIMSIFQDKPNKYTLWFVDEVQKIVNNG